MLIFGGCSGDCGNLFSVNHSMACNVAWGAAVVAVAPVALASNALDEHRDNARREDTWRRLQANEPGTVAACVIECRLPSKIESDDKKWREVYERSVEQVISWWGDHPQSAQMPALMAAYLNKGARLMKSDPSGAKVLLRRAAALAADPGMASGLNSHEFGAANWNESFYNDEVRFIQEDLMVLRYQGAAGHQPDADNFQCQAIAAWPPAWMKDDTHYADYKLQEICRNTFHDLFQRFPPDDRIVVVRGVIDPT